MLRAYFVCFSNASDEGSECSEQAVVYQVVGYYVIRKCASCGIL